MEKKKKKKKKKMKKAKAEKKPKKKSTLVDLLKKKGLNTQQLVIDEKLKKLNIKLPNAPDPVGAYVAYKKVGNLLFISGQLPIAFDGKIIKGKIGKDLTLEEGQNASRLCVSNILAQAKKAMNGDLNKIKNCIKITGFVNSADNFTDQPKVINPASEALSTLFGEKGKHARAAISTNSLPLGVAVEIDAIFEIV